MKRMLLSYILLFIVDLGLVRFKNHAYGFISGWDLVFDICCLHICLLIQKRAHAMFQNNLESPTSDSSLFN